MVDVPKKKNPDSPQRKKRPVKQKCPICNMMANTGSLKNGNRFFCSECAVEFMIRNGSIRVFRFDRQGRGYEIKKENNNEKQK